MQATESRMRLAADKIAQMISQSVTAKLRDHARSLEPEAFHATSAEVISMLRSQPPTTVIARVDMSNYVRDRHRSLLGQMLSRDGRWRGSHGRGRRFGRSYGQSLRRRPLGYLVLSGHTANGRMQGFSPTSGFSLHLSFRRSVT